MRLLRLFAAASWSSPTILGMSAFCAPTPNEYAHASTAMQAKQGHTCGCGSAAFATAIAPPTIIPLCWISISRRRSNASANAPPTIVRVSSGTSWASDRRPTSRVDPVSAYTW